MKKKPGKSLIKPIDSTPQIVKVRRPKEPTRRERIASLIAAIETFQSDMDLLLTLLRDFERREG